MKKIVLFAFCALIVMGSSSPVFAVEKVIEVGNLVTAGGAAGSPPVFLRYVACKTHQDSSIEAVLVVEQGSNSFAKTVVPLTIGNGDFVSLLLGDRKLRIGIKGIDGCDAVLFRINDRK